MMIYVHSDGKEPLQNEPIFKESISVILDNFVTDTGAMDTLCSPAALT